MMRTLTDFYSLRNGSRPSILIHRCHSELNLKGLERKVSLIAPWQSFSFTVIHYNTSIRLL